jgi:hypothetical protein
MLKSWTVFLLVATATALAGCTSVAPWYENKPPFFAGTWELVDADNPDMVDGRIRVYNKDLTGHVTLKPGKMKRFTYRYDDAALVENYDGVEVVAKYRYYPKQGILEREVAGAGWSRYSRR